MKLFSILQLMRPANIVTAIADIFSGIAIAGFLVPDLWEQEILISIFLLILATIGLYSGGIVFNDVFDIEQDKISRPERVIPSGRVSLKEAKILGSTLFLMAIIAAFMVSNLSGIIAVVTMLLALLYDKFSKHQKILGPINMGMCRGANLILGMSINQELPTDYWYIGILPVVFIAAITLTAQKETKGKNKLAIIVAMFLDFSIVGGFILMSNYLNLSLKNTFIFLLLWLGINVTAKIRAVVNNEPKLIKNAVKMGILSLIPLNASYTAGFSSVYMALFVMCLLPLSMYLAKKFPVT